MSIKYDTHMHCSFSTDSDTPMEQMVLHAVSLGLDGVCFTDHMDLDLKEIPGGFVADPDEVLAEITRLRGIYDHRFTDSPACGREFEIGFGLEFGMQPHLPGKFSAIARQYPLDFIPASCHLVDGRDPYYPQVWDGWDKDAYIRRYLEAFYENIRLMEDWDSLAHLDYIIRYIPGRGDLVYDCMKKQGDLVEALLRYVIDQGKCLEVNTAGFKYGFGQPHPSPSILKRYRELGGTRITIGSDAHAPQHIAGGFRETADLLLSLGFRTYTVFRERAGTDIAL